MQRQGVILHTINISKMSEMIFFQLRLPSDVESIIGIETTVFGVDAITSYAQQFPIIDQLKFKGTMEVGNLYLKSPEILSAFYSESIRLHDNSLFVGDFSESTLLRSFEWVKGRKREETPVKLNGKRCITPVIFGSYEDSYGKVLNLNIPYSVNVYLWYNLNY